MNVHQTETTLTRLRYLAMYDTTPLARMFRELDAHLSAGGTPPEAWREGPDAPADERDEVVVTFTRDQVEAWAGRPLTDDEADRLDDVIPNSSIPEAVATIVDNL